MKWTSSLRLGAPLSTGNRARLKRVESALCRLGLPDLTYSTVALSQASATVASVANCALLVSYEIVVAIKYPDGTVSAVNRQTHSRTTDRAIDAFIGRLVPSWFSQAEFDLVLRSRFK